MSGPIVAPAAADLFTYAVVFGERRKQIKPAKRGGPVWERAERQEWIGLFATRPFGYVPVPFVEKPLGAAWTGLAHLKNDDRDGTRRLLHDWGLWGFADLVYEWARESWSAIYPGSGRPKVWTVRQRKVTEFAEAAYDTAAAAIGPLLFQFAAAFRVAAGALLVPETWSGPLTSSEDGRAAQRARKALAKRPAGRLAALSVLRVHPGISAVRDGSVEDREIMRSLEVLARPPAPIEEEAFVPPVIYAPPSADAGRGRKNDSALEWFRKAAGGYLPSAVYFTDSFLALCWREFLYAIEHNALYRKCANTACGRFIAVQRGHRPYCDDCRRLRPKTPRGRLIAKIMSDGHRRDKAEEIVREYHRLEQRGQKGVLTSGERHRWNELRQMLRIRGRSATR